MDVNKECLTEWKVNHKICEKEAVKKPKYNRLRLSDKLDIIRRLDSGENHAEIASFYSIGRTTISWIKKKRDRILWYSQLQGQTSETLLAKKMMTNIEDTPFEKALFAWFEEKRDAGESITGPAIQEEALRLNKELGGPADFKASNGWLTRFKKRHGIRQMSLQGVKLGSVDFDSAKNFCDKFEKLIEEHECTLDNIYNAVKTGLQWNALPQKNIDMSTGKLLKDRVTLIACVNANGSHKLPMMVVGRSKNPRSFKDFEIPVKYIFHGNSYPNEALFEEWFIDMFLPEVKKRPPIEGNSNKIILLMDMVPSYTLLNIAKEHDVVISIFPPHVTSVIQPLNQNILENFKKHYKQSVFNEMLVAKDEKIVNKSDKRWTMKDCCFSIAAAWDSFTEDDFHVAWRKLLKLNALEDRKNQIEFLSCGYMEEDKDADKSAFNESIDDLSSTQNSMDASELLETNVSCTMEVDESTCGSDNTVESFRVKRENYEVPTEDSTKEELWKPTAKDALKAVNTIFQWVQNQKHCSQQDIADTIKLRLMIIDRINEQNDVTN